jgi:hypothetical protein
LLGELGKRVTAAVVAASSPADPQAATLEKLVDAGEKFKRLDSVIVSGTPDKPARVAGGQVVSGGKFWVQVASQDGGAVYLIENSGGHPRALFAPEAGREIEVAPGCSALLPPQAPLLAGDVDRKTTRELVVLVRRGEVAAHGGNTPRPIVADGKGPVQRDEATKPTPRPITADGRSIVVGSSGGGETGAPAVQVVGGALIKPAPADADIARLLKLAEKDAPGTWLAQRLSVVIEPSPTK